VNAIVETRDGEHWIATDGGVARFHPRRPGAQFESFALGGAPEAQFVNTLAEDRDGSLLAGTNRGLFRIVRGASLRIEEVRAEIHGYPGALSIMQVRVDSNGQWWVGTEKGLLRRERNGSWLWLTEQQGLPADFIGEIAFDGQGRVWAGTKRGAARLRGDLDESGKAVDLVVTERNGLPDPDVRAIRFTRGGKAWAGTMNGLAEWDSESGRVVRSYRREDGLADESVYAIAEDPAGNLWFGTRRGGLLQLPQSDIRTYGAESGLAPSGDDMLIETLAGEICTAAIGDSRRPLDCLESGRFTRVVPRLPQSVVADLPSSSQSALQDRTGAWWISTPKGLLRFPPAPAARLLANRKFDLWLMPGLQCRRLLEDRAGNIWVETRQGNRNGLAKWAAAERRVIDFSARLPERARANSISALADDGGNIWLGLGRPGGLFRLRDETVEEIPGIPPGTVNALHCDRRGHIWVATSDAGLAEVDMSGARPVVRLYDASRHLSSNEVWSIAEDRLGRVYAGTVRGVDRIEPGAGTVLHYSAEDGLAEGDIRSALCDRTGDLWFLSNQGLSHLRSAAERPIPPPIPRISEVRAGGKLELLSEFGETQAGPLRLEPDQSSVEIDFLAVSHRAPWRLRYQYLLGGAEGASWSEPAAGHSVRFPNLAPAAYRFEVRSIGEAGQLSPPAFVEFRLLPPIWRRGWFLTALLILTAAGGYALHRYRLNHLLAVERVRTRLATDLHDDLGAGLAEIAILSEVARRQPANGAAEALEYTATRARGLRAALGDIVWTVDPTHDRLGDLIRRMRETALTMLEAENRSVEFAAPSETEMEDLELPPDLRRHLFLFFRESVTNIARHAGATAVQLELSVDAGHLRILIRDNGRGFDSGAPASGRGLASLRYRAAEMRGELRLESTPGQGTGIELHVPLKRT
jgi:signal transduction histidine kinase/ligand-binding sensor domain-containing protein